MPDINSGSFKTHGLADLEKQLETLSDRIAKNVMIGALRAGAQVIRKEAQQLCPVSAEAHWLGKKGQKGRMLVQPGDLKKKGIKVRKPRRNETDRPLAMQVYIGKKYWFGRFVEMGHVIARKARTKHQRATGTGHQGYVPPHPFMRPAFDAKKEAAVEQIKVYAGPRIEKEAAKQGK